MIFEYTLILRRVDNASFYSLQDILIFYIGIKLEMISNNTPIVNFVIAFNLILTNPVGGGGTGMGKK
jgi:hypothetical protein